VPEENLLASMNINLLGPNMNIKSWRENEMGTTCSTTEGDDKCYPENMKSQS
jgi:hypothetical protein